MHTRTLTGLALSLVIVATVAHVTRGQDVEHGMTPADLERGGQIFLASCAACHGADGDAIAGTDLGSGVFKRASTDTQLAALIRAGIAGTPMPPNNLSDSDAARVVAYLRSLPAIRLASGESALQGDASRGRTLFDGRGRCRECHLVDGEGGFLGPDLSSVGLTRRSVELERALTDPNADIRTGNRAAVITYADGKTVTGRLLNQDTYSLQIIDASGRLLSVQKQAVKAWDIPSGSVMPSYRGNLTPAEIADVVSYLRTLKTPVALAPGGRGGAGLRLGGPGPTTGAAPAAGPRGGSR
jgi:putative heme-binding domain-containing protein